MKINDRRSFARLDFAEPPIKTEELKQEIATVARDTTVSTFGGMMSPNDETLASKGGENGYKVYDQIERDCHAFAVLQKRKLAVTSREWQVFPGGDETIDIEASEEVTRQIKNLNFDRACEDLLDANLKGFAVGEIIWAILDDRLVATAVKAKSQRRFSFMEDGSMRLKTKENLTPGIELPERKFIVHRFGSKDGNPYGLGLGTRLFWPTWFKRQGITFWLTFADKFGSPTVVGKYPVGTVQTEQDKLLAACGAVSREAGVIIPEGMMLEFLEAARTGSIDCYERLCRYMDEQISEAVLGETGSTNQSTGGGSRARDEVGNDVRLEIAKSDADRLSETLNATLIRWIVDLNFPGAAYPQIWRNFAKDEDLRMKAYRDQALIKGLGLPVGQNYAYETYGIPKPEKDEPLLNPLAYSGMGTDTSADQAAFAERDISARSQDNADLEALTDRLSREGQPPISDMIEQLRKITREATSLDDLQNRILEIYGKFDQAKLAEVMQNAFMTAEMMGRFKVSNGKK